ncbi:vezatin [Pristis pectinata]|uniref:vezatin n=1 Tax=Pristis pectinata TaxID=685728 RepID=UPI00223E002C|nr:vezatin [Pristis pectinata]
MGEEFDEELVLENSPLYQYLQDVGHTDFETCPSLSWVEECSPNEEPYELGIPSEPERSFLSKGFEVVQKWNPFSEAKRRKDLESLDIDFQLRALCTILEQEVLLQEDVELIELLDPSILSSVQAQQQRNGYQPTQWLSGTPSIWDLSILAAFAGVFIMTSNLSDAFPWVMVGMFGLSLYMVFRSFGLWKRARLQESMRKCSNCLENLVANSHAFSSLVRKTLRQIQELEVISRGFMLVTAACPASKLGSSWQQQGQQLIGLRKAVYNAVKSTYRASRMATCYLLKCYPLNSETDNVTNYLCAIPLSELGLGLNEEVLSDKEAQELTDGYSLRPLKLLFQLWVGQNSEFFRRLVLLLSPVQTAHKSHVSPGNLAHQITAEVIHDLSHAVTTCLEELKRSYELHRYLQHQPNLKTLKRTKHESSELKNIFTVVRSLQLHLKVLITEVITLEDHLEKLHESREQHEVMPEVYHDLDQKLKLIKPHMEATMDCWDEARNQVDKLVRTSKDQKDGPEALGNDLLPALKPSEKTVIKIKDQDPVPEEQELEAYVEESDSDGDFRSGVYNCLSPAEREKEKREREESRRVLQELKSVLGLKASELERQKWKQLLFNDQAALKTLPSLDLAQLMREPVAPEDMDENDQGCGGHLQEVDLGQLGTFTDGQECCRVMGSESTDVHLNSTSGSTILSGVTRVSNADGSLDCCSDTTDSPKEKQENLQSVYPQQQQAAVRQRLAERHGPASLHLTSALAAQAVARSHTFASFQEQTFGDDDDDEGEDEGGERHSDVRNEDTEI